MGNVGGVEDCWTKNYSGAPSDAAHRQRDVLMQAGESSVLVPLSTSPSSLRSANRYGANARNNGDQYCAPRVVRGPPCRGCARPDDARSSTRRCGPQQSAYGDTMTAEYKILVIDDDDDLRRSLQDQLGMVGEFKVLAAETAANAIDVIKKEHPDLVVLDVGLPDMDGRELCKHLRKHHFKKPILMLTGNTTDADQILGFDSGANDYVTKPFKFPVLLARIRVHLRQHEQSEDAVFAIGPYVFKPSGKILFSQMGSKIHLTEKETLMLKLLYGASGKAISREKLMDEVWGSDSDAASRTLDTHIYRLRQKIEKEPSRPQLLVTEDGGYKLALRANASSRFVC